MSIQIIHSSASTDRLTSNGAVSIPLGEPVCKTASLEVVVPKRSSCKTGIWECSPGRFERQVAAGEVMHFLSGCGEFRSTDGTLIKFSQGDTLFFSPSTYGVWDIKET